MVLSRNPRSWLLKPVKVLSFILIVLGVNGQRVEVADYFQDRQEIYISFPSELLTEAISQAVSVDYIARQRVYAYVGPQGYAVLLAGNIPYTIERSPGEVDFELNMKSFPQLQTKDLTQDWDFYPTYEAYESLMYQFALDFPHLCEVHTIAELASERKIMFISINVNDDPKPRAMYTSTMHGDETAGFVLSLRLIHHLLTQYGNDDEITALLNGLEVWISPNENPDGTYTNDNSTVNGATRGNSNGVDLNRNYPNPVQDPFYAQQPETTAMINFSDTRNFVLSANMHGGIELVNYPFDSWLSSQRLHADHDWWLYVMQQYVDTVREYAPANYMTGMGNGITHGGDWYIVYGSRQDFFNYYRACREFTLELSNQKLLNPTLLPAHWEYNYRSLLNYLWQATYGLRGTVTNAYTGEPVEALIELPAYDQFNSEVSTHLPHGDFYRVLPEGSYNVTVSAAGFHPATFENIQVEYFQTQTLDVALWPLDMMAGDVNGDGVLDVADVVMMVEFIMGKEPEGFIEGLADLNGDGIIDVKDVVVLINLILTEKDGLANQKISLP